jgi:hypothetical protein
MTKMAIDYGRGPNATLFDGITGNEKGPNAATGEITTNVVNADGQHLVDSDGDGTPDSWTGLLVGDLNLDGVMNNKQ